MVTARMPLERFIEEHIESLKENYICPLCEGVFYNATSDPCGHVFCFECLDITLEKIGKCPISNNDVDIKDCHLVTVIDNFVKSRTITCGMKNCKWSGLLRDYFKHLDRGCEHVFVVCPNPKCKEAYPKWKSQIHKDECKYGYIDCKQCNSEVMKLYAENHYYNCPNVIINCSKGCGKMMLRKDLKDHIENECTHIKYNCPFKIIGCSYHSIKAEITKHIKEDYSNHFLLFKKQIDLLDKKINVVNKYDYMIHRQLKRLNLKEDFKKNINHLSKDDEKELYMKYLKQDNEFDKEVKDNEEIIDMEINNIQELSLKEPTFLNKKDSFVFLNILPVDNLRINLKSNTRKNNIKQEVNNDKLNNNNISTNVLFKTETKIKPEVLKEERMEKKRIMKERKIFERKLRKLHRQLEKQKEKKFKLNESGNKTRREGKIYRKKKNKLRRLLGELKRGRPRKENNLTGPYDIEYKYFKVPKKEVEKVTNPSNYVPYNKIEVVIDDDKKKKLSSKEQVERDSRWNMEPDSSTSSDLQSSDNNSNFNINNLSDSEMKQDHRNRQVKEKKKISSDEKLYRKLHNRIDIDKVSLSSDTTSNNEEEDEEDEEDNDSNEDSEETESDKDKTDEKEGENEEEEDEEEEEEEEEKIAADSSSEEVYRGQDIFKKYDKQSSTIRRRNNSLETNELTLDMINSSKEISLEGKVATLTKINHKNADSGFNFKTLFASIFINGSKIKWVVKILRMQRRMALGIGVQEDIIANKHDLFNSKGNINKGVCVVTSNACFFSLYGNKDPVKMNIKSNFKQDDIVEFAYDYTTDLLTVTVLLQTDNGIEKKTAFQISEIGGNLRKMLVPIIMFLDIGDSAIMDLVYQKY